VDTTTPEQMLAAVTAFRVRCAKTGIFQNISQLPFFLFEKCHQLPRQDVLYLLFLKGKVVYVGITGNVSLRMRSHRAEKHFDAAIFQPLGERFSNLQLYEESAICFFQPPLNGTHLRRSPKRRDVSLGITDVMYAAI
jgi:hypothetical protein